MADKPPMDTQTYGIIGGLLAAVWGFIQFKKSPRRLNGTRQQILERLAAAESQQWETNRRIENVENDLAEVAGNVRSIQRILANRGVRGLYYNPPAEPQGGAEK